MKRICIRADGNDKIATGHIMRCLSIADELKKLDFDVVFVTADDAMKSLIGRRGYRVDVLDTTWDDLDGEIGTICEYVRNNDVKVILIDSYYVTKQYLERISTYSEIVYIDDIYRFAYPVHTLLNYGVFADVNRYERLYNEKGLSAPNYLLGGEYIPLRKEFAGIVRDINPIVDKVLITTGGTDRLNVAGELLEKLVSNDELASLEYHVIVGCFNNNKYMLKALAERTNTRIILHENVNNMSDFMTECDIAISASGSTLYELCACGTPTICFEIAPNQEGAEKWERDGYMLYAGNAAKDMDGFVNVCIEKLTWYMTHYDERCLMSARMRKLVDGKGASRVAEYLCELLPL